MTDLATNLRHQRDKLLESEIADARTALTAQLTRRDELREVVRELTPRQKRGGQSDE